MTDFLRKLRILAGMLADVFRFWRSDVLPCELNSRACCDGRECCCGGQTLAEVYGEKS